MNAGPCPVECDAPDISPYRLGNPGIGYATTFDGAAPVRT